MNPKHALFALVSLASLTLAAQPAWKVTDSLAHPQVRFTQGLSWDGRTLYESTGLVGSSRVFRMDSAGKVLDSASIPAPYFGEGSAKVGDDLLVLTWQGQKGFVLDAKNLATKGEFPIPGEGWGLAYANGKLWLSDGSDKILQLAPDTREVVGALSVKFQGKPVPKLNELEVVGDKLLANVWYSDSIAVIDMKSGNVTEWLDLAPLAKAVRKSAPGSEVLNGMAWDGKRLWVTGKLWPVIYALEVSSFSASGTRAKRK